MKATLFLRNLTIISFSFTSDYVSKHEYENEKWNDGVLCDGLIFFPVVAKKKLGHNDFSYGDVISQNHNSDDDDALSDISKTRNIIWSSNDEHPTNKWTPPATRTTRISAETRTKFMILCH